jgi:hypothetical protein
VLFIRKGGKIWYSHTCHRRQYGACALHAGYLSLQTHTQNIYCFSTAQIIARTRLSTTLSAHCLSCSQSSSIPCHHTKSKKSINMETTSWHSKLNTVTVMTSDSLSILHAATVPGHHVHKNILYTGFYDTRLNFRFMVPCIVFQYVNMPNLMSLYRFILAIKNLYMFRAFLAHPQEWFSCIFSSWYNK